MALLPGYSYPQGAELKLATWNVEHFVDLHDNPYIRNDREDAPRQDLSARHQRFADVIRLLDADVVVLQEIESAAFAQALADSLFPDLGYQFFAGTESMTWYMNVVVMSRVPLGVLRSYASVTTPITGMTDDEGRPEAQQLTNNRMWIVDVLARPSYHLTVVGAHLKAGRGDRNEAWRSGQIRFLHAELARLRALDPDRNLAIAGDLNALPDSPEMRLLLNADDATGSGVVFRDPFEGTPVLTHPADEPARQLDYVLLNTEAMPELVRGSAEVFTPYTPAEMEAISDHLPVVVTLATVDR